MTTSTSLALPEYSKATLPVVYERAKAALATCQRIDECKDWADKAAALASYARQADDQTLHDCATRISARAVRRCGELLNEHDARGDHRKSIVPGTSSKRDAAETAGMSKRQQVTAVRVANVPDDEFETAVESDHPPTITQLAERGTKSSSSSVPEKFKAATHLLGICRDLRLFTEANDDAALVADALAKHEAASIRATVAAVEPWLQQLLSRLQERYPC